MSWELLLKKSNCPHQLSHEIWSHPTDKKFCSEKPNCCKYQLTTFLTSSYGWCTGKNWPNFLPGRKIGRQWTTWLKQRKTRQFFACKTALSSERPANRHKDQLTTVQGNWTSFDNLNQGKTDQIFLLANWSELWEPHKPPQRSADDCSAAGGRAPARRLAHIGGRWIDRVPI